METVKLFDTLLFMPSKNRVKQYSEDSYYHVYNRGVDKQNIFKDDEDYRVFLNLFKRYLSSEPIKDRRGREYKRLHSDVQLLSYCLMPNHFHLFLYQIKQQGMTQLMQGICTSYTLYFNKKYERTGPLFQDIYKASMIVNDSYLLHISRYIHLNPKCYENYEYSSVKYFLGSKVPVWLSVSRVLDLFDNSIDDYKKFLSDYSDYKESLEQIKSELAG